MIHSIRGHLIEKTPTRVVIDVGGISFQIGIPLSTFDKLPGINHQVEVLTYLNVREDALELYGFKTEEERVLFKMLIGITKIGPKLALGIMSGTTPDEFKRRIVSGDEGALTALPGIGLKTAKRIIVELKEKFVPTDIELLMSSQDTVPDEFEKALSALVSLGLSRGVGFRILSEMKRKDEFEGGVEQIIKVALTKV